ncbi:hypothetical protein [Mycobacterium sp. pW045]|uniref:hypothetical protein n=1 Tax=Mycobacterium sp. pW045 TaxID=3238984 RepID=UPI00351B145F
MTHYRVWMLDRMTGESCTTVVETADPNEIQSLVDKRGDLPIPYPVVTNIMEVEQ